MPIPGQFTTLRVRWPQTIDGINLAVDEDGKPIFMETELPLTARPFLEKENMSLPIHLRKKITVMNYHNAPQPETIVKGVGVEMLKEKSTAEKEIEELKARLAKYESDDLSDDLDPGAELVDVTEDHAPAKAGRGRPRKS